MSAYTEFNMKDGMPLVGEAMDQLKAALERFRKNKYRCVLVIHGYGSTGRGGRIHDEARRWLTAQARCGKIKSVIYGEEFSIFNFKALELKNQYNELEPLLRICNHGVTVVEL